MPTEPQARHQADYYAPLIVRAWTRTRETILEAAKLCAEANRHLDSAEKAKLIEALPFEAPTFSKLAKIGADHRLVDLRDRLPPCYSTIYAVSQLGEAQLKRAVDRNLITTDVRRTDIERFRKRTPEPNLIDIIDGREQETEDEQEEPAEKVLGTLYIPSVYSKLDNLRKALNGLKSEFGIRFVERVSRTDRAMNAAAEAYDRKFRSLARQLIKRWKANKLAGKEHLNAEQRKKALGYFDDEYRIHDGHSRREIEEILCFIGLEDEIPTLREEAMRAAL